MNNVEFKMSSRKNSMGEWIVRCYVNGKHIPNSDYFTDDKADAIATRDAMAKREETFGYTANGL